MPSFTVIVPALNEEDNLRPTVEGILKEIGAVADGLEVLVFDDASTDATAAVADELAAADDRVRAFHNPRRLNIGGIYKAGVRAAGGDYLFLIPGDNEMRLDEIARGVQYLDRADAVLFYVTNARAARGWLRWFLSGLYVRVVNLMFGTRFRYTNSTNIFRTELLRQVPIRTDGFAYQTEAVVKSVCAGTDFVHVGIQIKPREHGTSKALSWGNVRIVGAALLGLWWEVRVRDRDRYRRPGRLAGVF